MDRILDMTPECLGIADDVVVHGRNAAEQDDNLWRLTQVDREEGLVFNSKKCVIKTDNMVFFGSVYGHDGIRPDPDKIEDIHMMPTPHRFDELPGTTHTSLCGKSDTTERASQEGRLICLAGRPPTNI